MGCGLGKTATCLDVIADKKLEGDIKGVLVVAPLRVCNLTWANEIEKWDNMSFLKIANLRTGAGWRTLMRQEADIYTINYEALPKFVKEYCFNRRATDYGFNCVIFDELTKAKNPKSKRINGFRHYAQKMEYIWGLTGTPAPNSLMDLFAQMRLLDDGKHLGKSFTGFKQQYFHATDYQQYRWEPNDGARERIYKHIAPIALTLRSSDWLNIPDVEEEDISVTLPTPARSIYDRLAKELFIKLTETENIDAVNAAVLLNKLLQVCGGAVYTGDGIETPKVISEIHDAKIKALRTLFNQDKKSPLLVGYAFKHECDRIAAAFPQAVRFDEYKGEAAQKDLLARWNAGKIPMLLAHPASAGHGLNMQEGGSRLAWFSLTWSRELYDQFIARIARQGQDEITRVFRLICKDSADEAVAETLRNKEKEQGALLSALTNFQKTFKV